MFSVGMQTLNNFEQKKIKFFFGVFLINWTLSNLFVLFFELNIKDVVSFRSQISMSSFCCVFNYFHSMALEKGGVKSRNLAGQFMWYILISDSDLENCFVLFEKCSQIRPGIFGFNNDSQSIWIWILVFCSLNTILSFFLTQCWCVWRFIKVG